MKDPARFDSPDAAGAAAELDLRLTRALEAAPEVVISDDFAHRVLSALPPGPILDRLPASFEAPVSRVGERAAIAGMVLLFVLLLWLAMSARAVGSHAADFALLTVGLTLALEFAALALWIAVPLAVRERGPQP